MKQEEASIDFDWQGLAQLLGESAKDVDQKDYQALSLAIGEVLRWIVDVDVNQKNWQKCIARRACALTWALWPSYWSNASATSLTKLARILGVSKSSLSQYCVQIRRKWSVHNRSFAHGWNYQAKPPTKPQPKPRKR